MLPTKMKISQLKNRLAKSSGRGNKSQVVSAQMEMISLQKRLQRMEEMVETHFGAAARTLERVDTSRVTLANTTSGDDTHCVCVIGPGATLNGLPMPCAPTSATGPLWSAYCAS